MKTAVLVLMLAAAALCTLPFKNVQGPAEEFNMHKLPSPTSASFNSDSAMFPIFLRKDGGKNEESSWTGDLPVDSDSLFTVALVAKNAKDLQLEVLAVKDVHGHRVDDLPVPTDVHNSWFGFSEDSSAPTKSYEYKAPVRGVWTIKIHTTAAVNEEGTNPSLYLIAYNESPDRVSSHLGSYMTHTGERFSVIASMEHTDANGKKTLTANDMKAPLIADLDITTPSGETFILQMHDDGQDGDSNANDGIYAASFSASVAGSYSAQVVMRGQIGELQFVRTSQHLVAVVDKRVELTQTGARVNVDMNDEMAEIEIPATIVGDAANVVGKKFKAYAEVWATQTSSLKPIAFITGMTIAKKVDETHVTLPLKMSMKWLSKYNAQLPVVLRNVYVQDVATSVPLSTAAEIKTTVAVKRGDNIYTSANALALMRLSLITNPVFKYVSDDETMFFGKRPTQLARSSANDGHKVILVHGYCSEGTPFTVEDFPGALVFLDKKANRDHDTFAIMIGEFGKDLPSFSVIGHSQAGPASLQLLTFYWSKQDVTQLPAGKRLIQTVGSPWRGSGLSGSMASIGSVFGVGCGTNYDLTHEGSEQWLATIPAKTRAYVYYHTTQFAKGGTCSFGANWVLESPNDGTTEVQYANLDGGNAASHTLGQCHVTEMNFPAQCHDHVRNADMFKLGSM